MTLDPTFYTIADSRFFVGVVALLNSLTVTRNRGELVVLDRGLTAAQRARLEGHANVVDLPAEVEAHPFLLKPYPYLLDPTGIVAIVDSDVVITRSLADIAERAAAGRICVFPDHRTTSNRWFAEWADVLELRRPLRRGETYVNGGLIVVSVDRHPDFIRRYWEACRRVPEDGAMRSTDGAFWATDQDALNALLMSELPPGAVERLPLAEVAHFDDLLDVDVADERTLECRRRGAAVTLLHYAFPPKPWQPQGWMRVRYDAYVRLLRRLVFGDDVPVRLLPSDVPLWLRPTRTGRVALRVLDGLHGAAKGAVFALPPRVRRPVLGAREALFGRLPR